MQKVIVSSNKILERGTRICFQQVRYTHKPRWVPVAPSKRFRVPKRPQISVEDRNELFKLFTNYRTCMKAIYKQLEQELEKSFTGEEVLKEIAQKEEKEWQLCLAINNDWNTDVAAARDKRIAKEKEVERQRILDQLITHEEEKQKKLDIIEEQVRLEKEKSHFYITEENIDEAIENALDKITSYAYAIDIHGTKYHGKDNFEESNKKSPTHKIESIH